MRLWLISLKVDIHSFFYCRRTLYNSNSARKPADEQREEKAIELQKVCWGENSVVDLEAQQTLTKKLKITLGCIRDKYRKEI